jgi:hypothetical protein
MVTRPSFTSEMWIVAPTTPSSTGTPSSPSPSQNRAGVHRLHPRHGWPKRAEVLGPGEPPRRHVRGRPVLPRNRGPVELRAPMG